MGFDVETEDSNEDLREHLGRRWLCDTGCPFDLVSRETINQNAGIKLREVDEANAELLDTANGQIWANTVAVIPVPKFSDYVEPFVLEDTPDVSRCDVNRGSVCGTGL